MYGLLMASDERATEVYALQIVLLRLQVRDLADVVTNRKSVQFTRFAEHSLRRLTNAFCINHAWDLPDGV